MLILSETITFVRKMGLIHKKRFKMEKMTAAIDSPLQGLLGSFSEMPLKDLELYKRIECLSHQKTVFGYRKTG